MLDQVRFRCKELGHGLPVAGGGEAAIHTAHVDPALDLVVALTSRRTPESAARGQGATLIRREILPAVRRLQRAGQ